MESPSAIEGQGGHEVEAEHHGVDAGEVVGHPVHRGGGTGRVQGPGGQPEAAGEGGGDSGPVERDPELGGG